MNTHFHELTADPKNIIKLLKISLLLLGPSDIDLYSYRHLLPLLLNILKLSW